MQSLSRLDIGSAVAVAAWAATLTELSPEEDGSVAVITTARQPKPELTRRGPVTGTVRAYGALCELGLAHAGGCS